MARRQPRKRPSLPLEHENQDNRIATTAPNWKLRDVAIGLTVIAAWRGIVFLPRAWVAAIPAWVGLVSALVLFEVFLLAYPLLLARRRGQKEAFGWPRVKRLLPEAGISILVVIALVILLASVGYAIRLVSPGTSLTPEVWKRAATTQHVWRLVFVLVAAFTLVPVCEEVFFRGFLHNALRTRMPIWVAGGIQSLLFAVMHTYGALHTVLIFFLGTVLTAVYEWRKTLLAPILVHSGQNLVAVMAVVLLMLANANAPMLGIVGQDHENGCQVQQVLPESSASDVGIQPGDVITHFDGEPVRGIQHLGQIVRLRRVGDHVTVRIVRNEVATEVEVVLRKGP